MTLIADTHPLLLPAPVVLFDLDGTLTDSATGVINGFLHALSTIGVAAPAGNLERLLGPPMTESLRALGLDDEHVAQGLTAYMDYYSAAGWAENALFDGVGEMLAAVRRTGSRLAVATSKNELFAERILTHFGVAGAFEFIGGASEDGTRRAKADVIAHSLAALGIDVAAAADGGTPGVVMIGDREHDVHGAGRFGIPTVFVEYGYGAAVEAAGATLTVDSIAELERILTGEQ
ncbi:HAD hydrolase-like protein [Rhodococcus chondri]|uniref:HAD hydrolase-like protein n=1 Tax=Rhodococcus chondri TaxID=3065941 RepID=A0ABU7JZJ3_9NOCA|nr:HAD hydrolase-like protein [Rhodococcus sp. CC-R104]MEE2035417.1 HAD hydrolase-like protein [Rhodococcus sp. CC-R104]